MEWSWTAWLISVAAVVVSALTAWLEGNWSERPGLDMGFVNHGGMWGDLLLVPVANAVIVPYLPVGPWTIGAIGLATIASVSAHIHWYRGDQMTHSAEHMWPAREQNSWWRNLSWAGWAHVIYVAGELSLVVGFLLHPMPSDVVLLVTAIFTIHVPIGVLQPRYFLTGHVTSDTERPLLLPLLLALWTVSLVKIVGLDRLAG